MKTRFALMAVAAAFVAGVALADDMKLTLTGDNEVPPVKTSATGAGTVSVGTDKSVSGSVSTTGMTGTMAHIHVGETGKNGPVTIPLKADGDGKWSVPAGTTLTDEQFEALKAGKLYVNVHSAAHPGGELRAQLSK